MAAIEFPKSPFRVEELADWLELSALSASNRSASAGNLERELNRLSCANPDERLGNVFTEIERREKATGNEAYPFERKNSYIELRGEPKKYPAYVFCLALSYYQWKQRKGALQNPWLLFEELACCSAKSYVGGEAVVFGTSSRMGRTSAKRFEDKIKGLAKELAEGEGFKKQRLLATKDSKLDLVAWKKFLDGRPSQIIIFGQCAAGFNWTDKLSELDPDAFWEQWMIAGKVSTLLRSVFIPHRLYDEDRWIMQARRARLLFDRCRIVSFAHHETSSGRFADRLLDCCRIEWELPV
ncbi:MAG: hypothetical protein NTX50_06615 [Candidatus Sumerlaeota bacterium]|nr:hypothetical protein [Candidatus Sumerlaeota bacterium]